MLDGFGLFGLLFLLLAGNRGGGSSSTPRRPPAPRPPPMLPPSGGLVTSWPSQTPTGLPAFPGTGWEYDEPPPAAVKQRAQQLVSVLVKQGIGAKQIEQTAGRWIAYRCEKMKSGKNGIVAYRLKQPKAAPAPAAPAPRATSSPAAPAAPAAYLPPSLPGHILTASSPGLPTATGDRVVQVVSGHWYQWTMNVDTQDARVTAEGISKIIAAAGGVDIVVSRDRPFLVLYVQQAKASGLVPLNKPAALQVAGATVTVTILDGKEVQPKAAPQLPPGVVSTTTPQTPQAVPVSTTAPRALSMLRRGDGIKPKAPNADVRVLQQKLGIAADGQFGAGTETSVKAYQKGHGLPADGIVGPQTWSSLFAVRA
jgi:peptidoglycan hydrolase-like protein with peptidoglycan-binding domain